MSNNYAMLRTLEKSDPVSAARCAQRLLAMRKSLADVRNRKSEGSLLLATWNIRDFDSNKFKFGPRLPESFFYIAEIIGCFDLVAIQEVNDDLAPFERLMRILGREWDYIVTDVTEGSGGNQERMAFVYNTEKVWFRKMAGEIVLPEGQLIVSPKKVKAPDDLKADEIVSADDHQKASSVQVEVKQQFARSPFVVAFQSGWFTFNLCTVHIYFGADTGEKLERRIAEIERLVAFFANRQEAENKIARQLSRREANYILLGDFNVVSPAHETMQALKSKGFRVPDEIDGDKVRKSGDHFYDQIAVRVADERFKIRGGGMIDLYKDVFRSSDEDMALYRQFLPKEDPEPDPKYKAKTSKALYKKWRTWQMSDHAPLWIEIATDFSESYLGDFLKDGTG